MAEQFHALFTVRMSTVIIYIYIFIHHAVEKYRQKAINLTKDLN